jgi:acyl-CoA synthetase (AMP-forming)/AMP-acid ligase II
VLGRVTAEAAERFGDASCYVASDGWTVSYRDLDTISDEVAAGLLRRGVGPGDVVALVLPTMPEYMLAYVAASKIGAITAGVNARLSPPERAAVLAAARPALVLATVDLAPAGHDVVEVVPAAGSAAALAPLRVGGAPPPPLPEDADRPVAIVFTSGTTGLPKGAVFCGRQLDFITQVDTGWRWADAPGGATFAATSFAHLGPMTKLPGTLVRGGTTHLLPRWRPADALRMIATHRMAGVGGIPTQLALMLQEPDFDTYDLSCLQAIVIGGGPATPALVREARARFGAALSVRYSCTEAGIGVGTAFTDPPEDAEVSVGRPHDGVEVMLLDEHDGVGEVCLRSPAVMDSYWNEPELTRAAFTAGGFVRTGDLGWFDEAGRLRLVGRSKEMYVRGGYNVYPMEVEGVLAAHPAVASVAVAARPDDVMGEIGVAVVVVRDGAPAPTLADLRSFGADRLAAYKLPEALVVTAALPLTAMEKLDRRALAAIVAPTA